MKSVIKVLLIISCIYIYSGLAASGYEDYHTSPYVDLYGETTPIFFDRANAIDITSNDSDLSFSRTYTKTIGGDFGDFARASAIPYLWNWTERLIIAPGNVKNVVAIPFSEYLHNITGLQGCKLDSPGCDNIRVPFLDFPFNDGDPLNTNYLQHPLSGMTTYLYYRAVGFDRVSAGLGTAMHSLLFEYTIESWQQPPSLNDLIITPGLGIPIGILVELSSDWLAQRDSQFLRALSYIVNPAKILIPNGDVHWQGLGGFSFRFNI